MNYFFVFQNKTFYEEYRGGYLWAPQLGKDSKKKSHWEMMKLVKKGDVIIHSYQKRIVAISVAKLDAYVAEKPDELLDEWQIKGWRVDTQYIPFEETIITSEYMEVLLKLQPRKYAPFSRIGRGNTGYLFQANKEFYEYIISQIAMQQNNLTEKCKVASLLSLELGEETSKSEIEIDMLLEEISAKQMPLKKLAMQAKSVCQKETQITEKKVYYRNPYIKEMVKQIAEGKCQLCGKEAPFFDRDHKPYLEEHHVRWLAKGGNDTMDNVVAICPNCHRKAHILNDDLIVLNDIAKKNAQQLERLLTYYSVL